MSAAQSYYDGLITQGYTPDQAQTYTQKHFPDFQATAPQVAPVDQFQVGQAHVQQVSQQHGVDPTQLVDTARHFDANQDGILQQSELQATAQQMTSTVAPAAPAPMAAAPMAAAPMGGMPAPMGGMPAPGMAAAPMGGMPAPGMAAPMAAAPMGGMPAPGMAAPMMAGAPMGGMGMMPAPAAASGGGGPLGYVAVACIVLTLVFSAMGIFGSSWLVMTGDEAEEAEEMGSTVSMGLTHMYAEMDIGKMMEAFGGDASEVGQKECDEFREAMMEDSPDGVEAECDGAIMIMTGDISDGCEDEEDSDAKEDCESTASAGSTGKIILWVATVAGLGATVLIIFNIFGIGALPVDTHKFGFIAGIAAGALTGIAVIVWYLMLPSEGSMGAGLNVWLTSTGAVTGIVAGILTKTHGNPSA